MPKFVIERELPGAGKMSDAEIKGVSKHSCEVLAKMNDVQWQHSYVTDDKIYCVYIGPNEEAIRQHAKAGGFPCNSVAQVRRLIDPTTSE